MFSFLTVVGLGKSCKFLLKFQEISLGEDLWSWCLILEQKVIQSTPKSSCIVLPIISSTLHCLTSANTRSWHLSCCDLPVPRFQLKDKLWRECVKWIEVVMCAPVSIHVYTQVMHLLLIPGFTLGPVTFPFKKAHYFFDPAIERRKPAAWRRVAENQSSILQGKSGVIPHSTMTFPRMLLVKVKKELINLILLPTKKIAFTAVSCTHSFHRVVNWHQGLKSFALQDIGKLHVDW